MDLSGKRFLVTGGAGLIGSHLVDQLVKEDVKEILIYDNFVRGTTTTSLQCKSFHLNDFLVCKVWKVLQGFL